MNNRNVGWLVTGISVFIFAIIWIFNYGVKELIGATCSHGPTCGMYDSLKIQTWISISIAFVVLLIGLFLIFARESEKIIVKKIKPYAKIEAKEFDRKSLEKMNLDKEEKQAMNLLLENEGSIYQSELAEKLGLSKVRITRILDSLEGRGLIERKRRGMTNIVVLKH